MCSEKKQVPKLDLWTYFSREIWSYDVGYVSTRAQVMWLLVAWLACILSILAHYSSKEKCCEFQTHVDK